MKNVKEKYTNKYDVERWPDPGQVTGWLSQTISHLNTSVFLDWNTISSISFVLSILDRILSCFEIILHWHRSLDLKNLIIRQVLSMQKQVNLFQHHLNASLVIFNVEHIWSMLSVWWDLDLVIFDWRPFMELRNFTFVQAWNIHLSECLPQY